MAGDREVRHGHAVHRPGAAARIYLSDDPREADSRDRAERHAEKRSQERFGVDLDEETRRLLERDIRAALALHGREKEGRRRPGSTQTSIGYVERLARNRVTCSVMLDGAIRHVIYDERLRRLITILPTTVPAR